MRALVVLPFPLLAEGGAAARCAIGLLRGLLAHGIDCTALAADARTVRDPGPPGDLPVETMELAYPSPLCDRAGQLVRPYGWLARSPFAARLRELAAQADVVHLVGLHSGALLPFVDRPALAQLDCVTRRDRDLTGPWTRDGRVTLELLRAERRTCRRARWLLASSDEVALPLAHAAPRAHVGVAPLPLDPAHYAERAPLEAPVAGLIGTAGWPPTANAVARLLTRVWPRVLRRRPDARLRLAGIDMEPARFAHLPTDMPGVEWCGEIESATEFLRGLGLLLYPLDRGSGGKVKVIESLALGVPVVTTRDGAEGLGGHGGVAVESGDDALAAAAAELLGDVAARRAAGDAAHATFAAHHAPLPATAPVVRLYERMLPSSAA